MIKLDIETKGGGNNESRGFERRDHRIWERDWHR